MEQPTGSFKFNEGIFQMERIHEIQSRINICKNFSLMKDQQTKKYGFETWFSLLNSLFLEFGAKLNDTELEEVNSKRLEIKKGIGAVIKIVPATSSGKKRELINYEIWNNLEEELFKYELKLKQLMVKHKISSPEARDPNKAVIH